MSLQLLFLEVIGGADLAHGIQAGLQAFLCGALLGELATEVGDGGGLPGVVLQGGLGLSSARATRACSAWSFW